MMSLITQLTMQSASRTPHIGIALIALVFGLQGCTVLAIADTVGSAAVGVAADVAIGTVKLTGKAVGAVADAVVPTSAP